VDFRLEMNLQRCLSTCNESDQVPAVQQRTVSSPQLELRGQNRAPTEGSWTVDFKSIAVTACQVPLVSPVGHHRGG
jgi:hypothetical protein